MSSKSIIVVLGIAAVVIFGYIGFTDAVRTWQNLQNQKNHIENLNSEYKKLDKELDDTKNSKEKSQEEVQQLQQEKEKLEQERQRLEGELQAKAEAKAKLAAASSSVVNAATGTKTASAMGACGDNQYAAYIYGMESGGRVVGNCNPTSRNGGGCLGIGQACPGSKLLAVCPNLDYACENTFFTNYAIGKYGSWEAAYNFHVANGWW